METKVLEELISQLKDEQSQLKDEVLKHAKPQKDNWDKLQAIAPIVSGMLISVMAGYFTFSYNQQQLHLQEIQTIEKFIPHMLGSEKSKKAAILAMSELTNTALAARFASLFASEGTVSALKSIAKVSNSKDAGVVKEALGTALENVAERYGQENRYAEAEEAYKSAIEIYEARPDSANPDLARQLEKLAYLYKSQCKYSLAEPLLRRSLKIKEKLYGPNSSALASTLRDLSELYQNEGKQIEADSTYQKALAIDAKSGKTDITPNTPPTEEAAKDKNSVGQPENITQADAELLENKGNAHQTEQWHKPATIEGRTESASTSSIPPSTSDNTHM